MTWSGPELVLQDITPKKATIQEVKDKLVMIAKGTGFDTGAAIGFIPSGTPFTALKRTLVKSVIEGQGVKVVSDVKLTFFIQEAQPKPGDYDAMVVEVVNLPPEKGKKKGKRAIMLDILPKALKITAK